MTNIVNSSSRYTELANQLNSAFRGIFNHRSNLIGYNFSVSDVVRSFLLPHIFNVLGVSTRPKMIRSNTKAVIASVKNETPFRDWSETQEPGSNVGSNWASEMETPINLTIPNRSDTPCPNPTTLGFVNFSPKSLWESLGKTLIVQVLIRNFELHNNYLPRLSFQLSAAFSF